MENQDKIERYLEKITLPRLYLEEIQIMNILITNTEIETVIKNLPQNKSPWPDGFTGDFYHMFTKELIPIPLKLFQKICRGRNTFKLVLQGHHHPDAKIKAK